MKFCLFIKLFVYISDYPEESFNVAIVKIAMLPAFGAWLFRNTQISQSKIKLLKLEINAGVKNILDSYQNDIDLGAGRDSAYIYGPSLPRTYFIGVKLSL